MADKGMRLTAHNGRAGKHGTYSAKHNDRNFDTREADHIDPERTPGNAYWHVYEKWSPELTFEEAEALFYGRHFQQALDERNERSIEQRHPERVKTMDDYRMSQKTCPEEQIMQIGNVKNGAADPDLLWNIAVEQINWEQEHFPNFQVLDLALHVDEEGAPHLHKRGVWIAHDEEGREIVGQAKALAEMGVEAPNPDKKYGKYNNAKMTYTRECREHFAELCLEHGLEMELEPREHSKSGRELEEFKAQEEQEKARQVQQELQKALQEQNRVNEELRQVQEQAEKARKRLEKAQKDLEQVNGAKTKLNALNGQIREAEEQLAKTIALKEEAAVIKKPGFFSRDETVTYHSNMYEKVRDIKDRLTDELKDAHVREQRAAKRETILDQRANAINPTLGQAQAERNQARELLENQEQRINERARELFEEFKAQELGTGGKKEQRLEKFLERYKAGDKTLLEVFKIEEALRLDKLAAKLEKQFTKDEQEREL